MKKDRKKFLSRATALTMALLMAFTMFGVVAPHSNPFVLNAFGAGLPDLPQPGELLADVIEQGVNARRDLTIVNYSGVSRIAFSSVSRFAELDRFEVIIHGDNLEFYGTGVVVYNTGQRSYDFVHEVFADGERLTLFIDHSLGTQGEMFVPFRSVVGNIDTVIYSMPIRSNEVPTAPSGSESYLATASIGSPNRFSRTVNAAGSVLDVFLTPVVGNHQDPNVRSDFMTNVRTIRATSPGGQMEQPPVATPEPDRTATPNPNPEDRPSSWAEAGVADAISRGLVPMHLQSNFTQPITRAEFSALAVALYESINGEIAGRITFADTSDVNVEKAAAIGIVSGVGDNRFNPSGTLNREQAAVMLARLSTALGRPIPNAAPTFADNDSISDWALDGVGQIQAAGIMGGVGDNNFAPDGNYTREQSIITILRMLELL